MWMLRGLDVDVLMIDCDRLICFFFFQAGGGIRISQGSRGLGDVFKGQVPPVPKYISRSSPIALILIKICFLYTPDVADE